MNIEEKLQHFMDVSLLTADQKYTKIVDEYKAKLDRNFEDHKTEALRKAAIQEKVAIDSINRDARKTLSHEQMAIKRDITVQLDKKKEDLFAEVLTLLNEYKATPAYYDLLLAQIKNAKSVAKNDDITIYLDPEDKQFLEKLSADSGITLTISEYSFMGGTRAVISSKNILIDNSFKSKLEDAKAHYTLEF